MQPAHVKVEDSSYAHDHFGNISKLAHVGFLGGCYHSRIRNLKAAPVRAVQSQRRIWLHSQGTNPLLLNI